MKNQRWIPPSSWAVGPRLFACPCSLLPWKRTLGCVDLPWPLFLLQIQKGPFPHAFWFKLVPPPPLRWPLGLFRWSWPSPKIKGRGAPAPPSFLWRFEAQNRLLGLFFWSFGWRGGVGSVISSVLFSRATQKYTLTQENRGGSRFFGHSFAPLRGLFFGHYSVGRHFSVMVRGGVGCLGVANFSEIVPKGLVSRRRPHLFFEFRTNSYLLGFFLKILEEFLHNSNDCHGQNMTRCYLRGFRVGFDGSQVLCGAFKRWANAAAQSVESHGYIHHNATIAECITKLKAMQPRPRPLPFIPLSASRSQIRKILNTFPNSTRMPRGLGSYTTQPMHGEYL